MYWMLRHGPLDVTLIYTHRWLMEKDQAKFIALWAYFKPSSVTYTLDLKAAKSTTHRLVVVDE